MTPGKLLLLFIAIVMLWTTVYTVILAVRTRLWETLPRPGKIAFILGRAGRLLLVGGVIADFLAPLDPSVWIGVMSVSAALVLSAPLLSRLGRPPS